VARRPNAQQLEAWKRGVVLEDGYKTQPVDVRFETSQGKGVWVRVIMGEGRKRQIRETCQQLGLPVVRIVRVRIGTLRLLGTLKPRQWRHLYADEVDALKGKETKKGEVRKFDHKKTNRLNGGLFLRLALSYIPEFFDCGAEHFANIFLLDAFHLESEDLAGRIFTGEEAE
jgi:23S rRNA pseudouridine2605 synthase